MNLKNEHCGKVLGMSSRMALHTFSSLCGVCSSMALTGCSFIIIVLKLVSVMNDSSLWLCRSNELRMREYWSGICGDIFLKGEK